MGWWRNVLERGPRNEVTTSSDLFQVFTSQMGTASGINVSADSALASVAVLACILVRAESLSFSPVDVFNKDRARIRTSADDHPVARLIAKDPNPLLTAQEFWRWKQITEDLRGNAYVKIDWRNGRPAALWPLTGTPPRVIRARSPLTNEPVIVYRYAGDEFTPAGDYPASDIMHFRGPMNGSSPYEGRSLVDLTRQNIGLGIATEEFFARFLSNGSHFPAHFELEGALTQQDREALQAQFRDGAGIQSAGKLRIFDRGLKLRQNAMSLKDADLTQHQRWILEQVCRTWRVPLPMVQDLTHGTYTNSEQADLWLSKYTMAPIATNTEGRIRKSLFLASEPGMFAKFNLNAMLRGDFAVRTAGYSVLINCGVLSPNEARAHEDWAPYEGGDTYRVPLNTAPANGAGDPAGDAPTQGMTADEVAIRMNAFGTAFRSGVTPESAAEVADLSGLAFTGEAPVTTRAQAVAALEPLLADARTRIMMRHADNLERGRPIAHTVDFARIVLAPIVAAANGLGVPLDVEALSRGWVQADEVEDSL